MATVKEQLYNAIGAAITADAPNIKTFGLYRDQFNNEVIEDPFDYPAVFLQFAESSYQSQGSNIQAGTLLLTFHVGFEDLDAEAFDFLQIIEDLHFALQGLQTADNLWTTLQRRDERQVVDRDAVIVWEIDYITRVLDETTDRDKRRVITPTVIGIEIIVDADPPRL